MRRIAATLAIIAGLAATPAANATHLTSGQRARLHALQNAVVVTTVGRHGLAVGAGGVNCPTTRYASHDPVWSRESLVTAGVTLGWLEVTEDGWCWNATRIVGWGGAIGAHYTFPGYCWSDRSVVDQWWSNYWERRAYQSGELGITTGLGCIGVRSDITKLYYRQGGGWNYR